MHPCTSKNVKIRKGKHMNDEKEEPEARRKKEEDTCMMI